jgi:DNA polymerase-3 subunit alpha
MTIEKVVHEAAQLNFQALALTDEGVLHGAITFYKKCLEKGIKPLIGMVVHINISEDVCCPCVLLAKNNRGYGRLILLSTHIQLHGQCTLEVLQKHHNDLIGIVPANISEIKQALLQENVEQVNKTLAPFKRLFHENMYLGIDMDHALMDAARKYHTASGMKMVALLDVRYAKEKDMISFQCLQAMKRGDKWQFTPEDNTYRGHHLYSTKGVKRWYSAWPELMDNTDKIAALCDVTFDFDRALLPEFPVPTEESVHFYLTRLCENAMKEKYQAVSNEVKERLNYELAVIKELAFSDYFLIVADFVQFAKDNGIMVGPGRGSAAGSLVAYLLGITNVDPLQYDLLFERFLNRERVTMPDIDIDFSDVRRDEVIDYIREKYGQDHVAQIITFGTFAARSLIRELMKTMDIDPRDQSYILKHIPISGSKSLVDHIKASEEFSTYIKQSEKLRILFTIAITLEGLPRHISTHAAGVVIGKKTLTEDVPLTTGSHDTYLTQYAMHELEAIGLLKIDILGLRNLTLLERIVQSIKRKRGVMLDIDQLPEADEKTFALLQKVRTNGIFQLESAGMKNVLTQLKPTTLSDIIALNALYRPGPMEQIPTYIRRKHGQEAVTYLHPNLEPILHTTYGVLIYQEQIMQVAHQFAGLTLGQADILRRAISKKNHRLIDEQKETFIQGCLKQGNELQIAEEVFSWIHRFANYGFNKSHSVAYSKIAYQLSYVKAHYPTEFFAHLFDTAMNDPKKLHLYVKEANELGITLLAPSINKSYAYFTEENGNIRIGLMAIKGIGYETVKEIIEQRKARSYTDLFDFCLRTNQVKRHALETLIIAGAFDETYDNRASLLASIDQAVARAELFGDLGGQGELFTEDMKMRPAYTDIEDFTQMQKLSDEKELLHMYVTDHPLKQFREKLMRLDFVSLQQMPHLQPNDRVKLIAIILYVKKIHTKRGDSMAFITLMDEAGEIDGVIFPEMYRKVNPILGEETMVQVEGKISVRENKKQIILDQLNLCDVGELTKHVPGIVYIKITEEKETQDTFQILKKYARKYAGDNRLVLHREIDGQTYQLGNDYNMRYEQEVVDELENAFGGGNVVFVS